MISAAMVQDNVLTMEEEIYVSSFVAFRAV